MSALIASVLLAAVVAAVASLLAHLSVRRALGVCLAGQMGAMFIRLCGLGGIALLLHLCWPQERITGLVAAAVIVVGGLALDARLLLRTLRTPTEERVRA